MNIFNLLISDLLPLCFGTLIAVNPRILVKSNGPGADRKRRIIRILGVVVVVAIVFAAVMPVLVWK